MTITKIFVLITSIYDNILRSRKEKTIQNKLYFYVTNDIWTFIYLSYGRKSIICNWIFNLKLNLYGLVVKYKTMLITYGFNQVYEINILIYFRV